MKKRLRMNKETLRSLQATAYGAGEATKKAARWTPVVMLVVGAAGCLETLGCYHN